MQPSLKKFAPLFSINPLSELRSCQVPHPLPPVFENLVADSTHPAERGGAHYEQVHSKETVDFIFSKCKKTWKKENTYKAHKLKCNVDITDDVDIAEEVDAAEN